MEQSSGTRLSKIEQLPVKHQLANLYQQSSQ